MENVYLWSEPRLDLRAYSEPGQYVVTTVVVRIISYGDHTFQML